MPSQLLVDRIHAELMLGCEAPSCKALFIAEEAPTEPIEAWSLRAAERAETLGWSVDSSDRLLCPAHGASTRYTNVAAFKDDVERQIPTAWRKTLREVVSALSNGDFLRKNGVATVEHVSEEDAICFRDAIQAYGATLVELDEQTWQSSVCMCYGQHWSVLVDLWTKEEGRSDLVLGARVTEVENQFRFKLELIYVP